MNDFRSMGIGISSIRRHANRLTFSSVYYFTPFLLFHEIMYTPNIVRSYSCFFDVMCTDYVGMQS